MTPLRLSARQTAAALGILLTALLASGAARADDAFEKRILEELKATSPDAAVAFQIANEARDKGELGRASEYYGEVHKMAPDFVHATRRQCNVEMQLHHRAHAIALCREAVHTKETAENLSSLAAALATPDPAAAPGDLAEAAVVAGRAMTIAPDDIDAHEAACGIALREHDLDLLRRCATRLQALAPNAFTSQLYYIHLALEEGRPADAEASLERAHANGLPETMYQALLMQIREQGPLSARLWWKAQNNARAIGGGAILVVAALFFWRAARAKKSPDKPAA